MLIGITLSKNFKASRPLIVLLGLLLSACQSSPQQARPHSVQGLNSALGDEIAYISNEDSGTISVLDLASLEIVDTIPVGRRPRGIHATSDGRYLFVAVSGSPKCPPSMSDAECDSQATDESQDGIALIDTLTRRVVKTYPGGSDPEQFDISADDRYLYIANEDAGLASVVDISSEKIIKEIPVGSEPEGVRVSPDGLHVLVTSESEHSVSVIDAESLQVTRKLDVGFRPRDLIFSADQNLLFVSCELSRRIDVFDGKNYSALGSIQLNDTDLPMGLVMTSDSKTLYVSNGRGKTVSKIDIDTSSVRSSVVVGTRPWGIAISSDDKLVFSVNGPSDDVTVIDAKSMTVNKKISVGETPWGIVIAPNPHF